MLDPALCIQGTPGILTKYWAALSWWIFHLLATPAYVIPFLLGVMGLPWILKPIPWKRLISGLGGLLLSGYLLFLSPSAVTIASKLLVRSLPADSGSTVDAIVVLGRGQEMRQERVDVAAQLWQTRRSSLVFASGHGDAPEIVKMLEAAGLPASAVDGEPCSRTTRENAQLTAKLLEPRNVHRILLVTDPPHMLRSMLTFRSVGFEVIPHPNPLPNPFDERRRAFLVLREYVGLISYGLMGRYSAQPHPADETMAEVRMGNMK